MKLPTRWQRYLLTQPETGMGYQVVSVVLRDGTVIPDVVIVQTSLIADSDDQSRAPFDVNDIVEVRVGDAPPGTTTVE